MIWPETLIASDLNDDKGSTPEFEECVARW